jgi:hypothetical protein
MTDEKTTREQLEDAFADKQLKREFPGRIYSRSELDHAVIEIPEGGGQPTFTPVEPPFNGGSSTSPEGPAPFPPFAAPPPPTIDTVSAMGHQMAAGHAGMYGFGMITITFDAVGSYRFRCSKDLDVTKAIGYLYRSILSLQEASNRS